MIRELVFREKMLSRAAEFPMLIRERQVVTVRETRRAFSGNVATEDRLYELAWLVKNGPPGVSEHLLE